MITSSYSCLWRFDQQMFAIVAIGVVAVMSGHVADIDIVNSLGHGQFAEMSQA